MADPIPVVPAPHRRFNASVPNRRCPRKRSTGGTADVPYLDDSRRAGETASRRRHPPGAEDRDRPSCHRPAGSWRRGRDGSAKAAWRITDEFRKRGKSRGASTSSPGLSGLVPAISIGSVPCLDRPSGSLIVLRFLAGVRFDKIADRTDSVAVGLFRQGAAPCRPRQQHRPSVRPSGSLIVLRLLAGVRFDKIADRTEPAALGSFRQSLFRQDWHRQECLLLSAIFGMPSREAMPSRRADEGTSTKSPSAASPTPRGSSVEDYSYSVKPAHSLLS
jgi:hypothetical protein